MSEMKQRTTAQNRALHKLFELWANALNDSGRDVMTTLKHDIEVPWNKTLIKELMWRPVMQAMTEKFSTTELDRMEIDQIYEVLNKHFGEKLGIYVPFPSDDERTE